MLAPSEYEGTPTRGYLDTGTYGLPPRSTLWALEQALVGWRTRQRWRDWEEDAEACRELFARLVGARPEDVALISAVSAGAGIVAASLPAGPGDNVVLISALTGDGIPDLMTRVAQLLPESPFLYPEDEIGTQSLRFFTSELVRETALEQLEDEVPYSGACGIEEFREDRSPVSLKSAVELMSAAHSVLPALAEATSWRFALRRALPPSITTISDLSGQGVGSSARPKPSMPSASRLEAMTFNLAQACKSPPRRCSGWPGPGSRGWAGVRAL